jgi:hypothetical protein
VEIRGMGKVLVLNCLLYSLRKKNLDFGTCGVQGGKNFLFNIESYIYCNKKLCVCVCVCV